MESSGDFGLAGAGAWSDGPLVLGVPWDFEVRLVRAAAGLAAIMDAHLICAFVDPASYLTEWAPAGSQPGTSLDPVRNVDAEYPSRQMLAGLERVLGPPGGAWSFRVLNGEVAQALGRLAESADAAALIVGGQRPGRVAKMVRLLEGSVSVSLTRLQAKPVLIVPHIIPRPGP
ncbi:universal stress protein [Arthrobacter sp. NicSoilB8]|uniref:universal stress protein n=1 Tax=Arthrobacter sp. NicSoilB8 TaxID=2830998 RepID=UPI001CC37B9D|nr:universal stress protein [Arthrobacter sp. NicSoilB8]